MFPTTDIALDRLTPTLTMGKKKGGGRTKSVAAHIRKNQGKGAGANASGDVELVADKRAPPLAPPLGVLESRSDRESQISCTIHNRLLTAAV